MVQWAKQAVEQAIMLMLHTHQEVLQPVFIIYAPALAAQVQTAIQAEAEVPAHTLKAKEAMVGRLTDQQVILAFLVAAEAAVVINGVTVEKEAKAETAP